MFTTAVGPGSLVLMTKGSPAISGIKSSAPSTSPSRLLAWDRNAHFTVESRLSFVDIYMSGVYLKQVGRHPVVIDADAFSKRKNGLIRFVRYFMLPV